MSARRSDPQLVSGKTLKRDEGKEIRVSQKISLAAHREHMK